MGEIWFGEDVQERVCDWIGISSETDEDMSEQFPGISYETSKIVDIGCGNAASLVYLAKEYNFQNLIGIDYSEPGIELAKKIVNWLELSIQLKVVDLMDLDLLFSRLSQPNDDSFKFDLLYDKGTFDAICLNEDKSMRNKYVCSILAMMKPNSYFVITSCNWTQAEVIQMFQSMSTFEMRAKEHEQLAELHPRTAVLKLFKSLKQPEYSFGGKSGSTVATVAFKLDGIEK